MEPDLLTEKPALNKATEGEKIKPLFDINELPFEQLSKVGLNKDAFLKLSDSNLVALLSGRRSDLIRFSNLEVDGNKIQPLDTKLSFGREQDGKVTVAFHPINKSIVNEFKLNPEELASLVSGKSVSVLKEVPAKGGKNENIVVQFDKDLNGFVAERQANIIAPEDINGVKLTEKQKASFSKGEEISVDNQTHSVNLKGAMGVLGKVAMFGLDGGLTMIIMAIIKHEREKAEAREKEMAALLKNQGNSKSRSEGGIITTVNGAKTAENTTRQLNTPIGNVLLAHGPAPFEHDKNNKPSYFVKIETSQGERTLWGVDLERAITKSDAQIGDRIAIKNLGNKEVQVEQYKRDPEGKIIGTETITAHRNEWDINTVSKAAKDVISIGASQEPVNQMRR